MDNTQKTIDDFKISLGLVPKIQFSLNIPETDIENTPEPVASSTELPTLDGGDFSWVKNTAEYMNQIYGAVLYQGKLFIVNKKTFQFNDPNSLRQFLSNKIAYDSNGEELGSAYKIWLESPSRSSYEAVVFKPDLSHKPDEWNIYRGMGIKPIKGDCSAILQHLLYVWCDGDIDAYQYLLSWLARMIQHPELQGQTIIVIKSIEGVGKDIITNIFSEYIFNYHSLVVTKKQDILGTFNDKLAESIFVVLNEFHWTGNGEQQGSLKALATDSTMTMEKKFMPKITVNNCTHIMITTNNDWSAPLDRTDRRYLILQANNDVAGHPTYFSKLANNIQNGGREALLYLLLNRDISNFKPSEIPLINIESRRSIKLKGASSEIKWLIDLLEDETIFEINGMSSGFIDKYEQWETQSMNLDKKSIINHYQDFCKNIKCYSPLTVKALSKFLESLLGVKIIRDTSGRRCYMYNFPSREVCNQKIDDYFGNS